MNYRFVRSIENCVGLSASSFDKVLKEGYLIYSDNNQTYTLSSITLIELNNSKIDWFDIIENDGEYFYVFKSKLFKVDFSNLTAEVLFKTEEEALYPYTKDIISIGSSNWRTKLQNFSIIQLPDQKLFSWEDDRELLYVSKEKIALFQNGNDGYLFAFDLILGQENWKILLDKGISGKRYFQRVNDNRILIQKSIAVNHNKLINIDLMTGDIIWEVNNTFTYYNYDELHKKLYGIGGNIFEVIDIENGKRESRQEISQNNLHISSHLTYFDNGLLYFSGHLKTNTPVFGAVNVNDGDLAFVQEVEFTGEKSFRNGLDKPVVVGRRLYVRDAMKNLHIYETDVQP